MNEPEPERGLILVYTGDGKGKTTAALGLCVRAVGHGRKIRIIQFIKSDWPYGEREGLKRLGPDVQCDSLGLGCIGILGDDKPWEEHQTAARKAFEIAREAIISGTYDIVILDEINVAMDLKLLSPDMVMGLLRTKPPQVHLVLTGRGAPPEILEMADLVTEMKEIKHPYRQGQPARKGIDF